MEKTAANQADAVVRTAIYTRVSTTKQEDGTSPTMQEKRCREEADRRGWEVAAVWHDSISGTKESRPHLDEMLAAGRRGDFQAVVVYDLDRLARDELTQLLIRRELTEVGLRLVALNLPGGDLDSDESVLTAGVLGSVAAYEKKKIVRRMQNGQRARFDAGLWGGGTTPFGYVTEPVDNNARSGRRAVPDLRSDGFGEADTVRLCARLIVKEGMTTGQAAARLNALGHKPRKAARWNHYVLRRMIENPSLTGHLGWAKPGCRYGAGGGTGAFGPEIAITLEPILTYDEFAAVTAALDAKRLGPRTANNVYPLSRGVLISPCGQRMHGARRRDRARREYWCPDLKRTPAKPERCSCPRLLADDVEWVVWTTVLDLLSDPAGLTALSERWLESAVPSGTGAQDLESVERAIGDRERRLKDGVRSAIAAGVDEATMREVTRDLQEEIEGLRSHCAELRSQLAEREARGEAVDRLARMASRGRRALERMGPREQDAVIRLMGLRVQVLAPDEPKGAPGLDIRGFVPHARVEELLGGRQVSGEDPRPTGPRRR